MVEMIDWAFVFERRGAEWELARAGQGGLSPTRGKD